MAWTAGLQSPQTGLQQVCFAGVLPVLPAAEPGLTIYFIILMLQLSRLRWAFFSFPCLFLKKCGCSCAPQGNMLKFINDFCYKMQILGDDQESKPGSTVTESSGWWKPDTGTGLKITWEPSARKQAAVNRAGRDSR